MPGSTLDFFSGLDAQALGINQGIGRFPSPWTDLAMQYAPRTWRDALELCTYLYANNSTYRKASERIVAYFITKIKLSGQADDELEKLRPIVEKKFNIPNHLQEIGEDFMCVGNGFASIVPSFIRMLKCTSCKDKGMDTVVKMLGASFEFRPGNLSFYMRCHKCRKTCRHMVHDYPDPNPENIKLVRRDPKTITIENNPERGISNYWMDIDPLMVSRIKGGDPFLLATTPWTVIQAIVKGQKYKFNPEYFYHMRQGCISGIRLYGWGLPSILSAFKDFFRLQMLRRYDETLMMDYIVPIRIISPAGTTGGNDMVAMANMNSFRQHAEEAIVRHRIDGADWNIFPFPVTYQAVGGEGRELAPTEAIKDAEDRLLNARGIPPQLYRGDLLLQTAPTALRVFERSWGAFVSDLNGATQWMVTALARQIKMGDVTSELASVTLVDDLSQEQIRLQLMQAQILSKETGMEQMNIDPKNERKRLIEEQKEDQRAQRQAQQELEMEQMNLDTPEGDADGTNDSGGATPMDIQGQGTSMAQQLLDPSVPEQARRQQLTALRQSNPTLHAVVIKEMERLRNAAGTAGQSAGMPQAIQQSQQAQQSQTVPTPGAAQSQPKTASLNQLSNFTKTAEFQKLAYEDKVDFYKQECFLVLALRKEGHQKIAAWNIDFSKTASAIMEPNLKNTDALVDSAIAFQKVAGHFPATLKLSREGEFRLIKWGAQKLGLSLDQMGDILSSGTLREHLPQMLGIKIDYDAKEISFE